MSMFLQFIGAIVYCGAAATALEGKFITLGNQL